MVVERMIPLGLDEWADYIAVICPGDEETGDVVVLSLDEWEALRRLISSDQVVAATADQPAFFWFRDKRVVTPRHIRDIEGVNAQWAVLVNRARSRDAGRERF